MTHKRNHHYPFGRLESVESRILTIEWKFDKHGSLRIARRVKEMMGVDFDGNLIEIETGICGNRR
jgi:hypothetical protein